LACKQRPANGDRLTVRIELREPGEERVMKGEQAMLYFQCGKMAAGKSTHARRLAAWTPDAEFDAITVYFQAPFDDEGFNVVRHERA